MNSTDYYKRKGIGIYTMSSSNKEQCSPLELHINLWCIRSKKHNEYALDFGIKFALDTKEILLLIPQKIDKRDVFDLGERLINNSRLLCSVFNENYQIIKNPTGSCDIINDKDGNALFGIYKLRQNASIIIKPNDVNETYTEINLIPQCDYEKLKTKVQYLYARFQITLKDLKAFAKNMDISNDFLQSAFSSSRLFDIRINDKRELDSNIDEKLMHEKWSQAKFNKLHFFYMSEVSETIDNGSKLHLDTRILEDNLWKDYFGDSKKIEGQHIAYHWKKTVKEQKYNFEVEQKKLCFKPSNKNLPFDSFTIFFKTTYSSYNKLRIFKYSFIVILLALISSCVFSILSYVQNVINVNELFFYISTLSIFCIIILFLFRE